MSSINDLIGLEGVIASVVPGYEFRKQQRDMASVIAEALQEQRAVCIEAGTGTGKSLAYLIPAACSGHRFTVSTGTKNLQEQLYFNDIPLLNRILPSPVSAVIVKGRNNYLCLSRWFDYLRTPGLQSHIEADAFRAIGDWVETTETGDVSEVSSISEYSTLWGEVCSKPDLCAGSRCENYRSCFIMKLKQRADKATIIIANHHLVVADLILRHEKNKNALPPTPLIVFDEAHLLEDIVTEYLGVRLGTNEIADLTAMITRFFREFPPSRQNRRRLNADMKKLKETSRALFDRVETTEQRFFLANPAISDRFSIAWQWTESLEKIRSTVSTICPPDAVDWIGDLDRRITDLVDRSRFIFQTSEPDYVYWVDSANHHAAYHAHPVDVSSEFSRLISPATTTSIFTSATLSIGDDFSYFQSRLGIKHAIGHTFESPFDYSSQGLLYIPDHLPDPGDPGFYPGAAREAERILMGTRGRGFVLCTSYRGMFEIHQHLTKRLPYRVFIQGESPKHRLIELFKQDTHSVLVATSSFWQGVDVPGEALSCVIIDKMPFTSPKDPVTSARIDFITSRGGNAFREFQLPEAIMQLKQGIGRLIRSKVDRGVVAILDGRIHSKRYGKEVISSLPAFRYTTRIDDLEQFFDASG